jgi:hypothetical protein
MLPGTSHTVIFIVLLTSTLFVIILTKSLFQTAVAVNKKIELITMTFQPAPFKIGFNSNWNSPDFQLKDIPACMRGKKLHLSANLTPMRSGFLSMLWPQEDF